MPSSGVVRTLPAELSAAICVVLHVPATGRSLLAPILDRQTALEASVPSDGEPLRPGRLYVAPPDRHLTVGAGRLALGRGPKENGVRPAVDPMLRSLAARLRRAQRGRDPVRGPRRRQPRSARRQAGGRKGDRAGPRGRDGAEHARERARRRRRRRRGAHVGADRPGAPAAGRLGAADTRGAGHDRWRRAIARRVRRRDSRVPSATVRCGRSPRAISCATAAAWATPTPRTR